jgi:hypothetical protein
MTDWLTPTELEGKNAVLILLSKVHEDQL